MVLEPGILPTKILETSSMVLFYNSRKAHIFFREITHEAPPPIAYFCQVHYEHSAHERVRSEPILRKQRSCNY